MTEYVWVLPRALLPLQLVDPVVFHPYVPGAVKTACGFRLRRYGGYRFLVRIREEAELFAKPCRRC